MSRLLGLEVVISTRASSTQRPGTLVSAVRPTTPEGVASQALPFHFRNFDGVTKAPPPHLEGVASSRVSPSRGVLPRFGSPALGVPRTLKLRAQLDPGVTSGVRGSKNLTSPPPRECCAGRRRSAPGTSLLPCPPWHRLPTGFGPTAARHLPAWRSCCAAPAGKDRPSDLVSTAPPCPTPVFSEWLSSHRQQKGIQRHFSNFRGRTALGAWLKAQLAGPSPKVVLGAGRG